MIYIKISTTVNVYWPTTTQTLVHYKYYLKFSIAFLDLSRSKPLPPILSVVTPEPSVDHIYLLHPAKAKVMDSWLLKDLVYYTFKWNRSIFLLCPLSKLANQVEFELFRKGFTICSCVSYS